MYGPTEIGTSKLAALARGLFFALAISAGTSIPAYAAGNPSAQRADRVERMHAEAEAAYRARRWSQALAGFNAVVAIDPDHAKSWLRIGNVQQTRRQWIAAASAYRKAARQPAEGGGADDVTRAKALVNLAAVNLELARAALAEFDRLAPGGLPDAVLRSRDEVGAAVDDTSRIVAQHDAIARRPNAADRPREPLERRAPLRHLGAAGSDADAGAMVPTTDVTAPPKLEIEYLRDAPKP